MTLWLICRTDGSSPRVVRSVDREAAIRVHAPSGGIWCIWRLGNFPEQYERRGMSVRSLGRPHLTEGDRDSAQPGAE